MNITEEDKFPNGTNGICNLSNEECTDKYRDHCRARCRTNAQQLAIECFKSFFVYIIIFLYYLLKLTLMLFHKKYKFYRTLPSLVSKTLRILFTQF